MRILITGGAGCLGSNLIEHWLPLGHDIFVIDNFATGKREVVPDTKGLTVRQGSIADERLVQECFEAFSPQIVVHAAASYKDPDDWTEDVRTNVIGSIVVARAARAHACSSRCPERARQGSSSSRSLSASSSLPRRASELAAPERPQEWVCPSPRSAALRITCR